VGGEGCLDTLLPRKLLSSGMPKNPKGKCGRGGRKMGLRGRRKKEKCLLSRVFLLFCTCGVVVKKKSGRGRLE